MVNAIAGVIYVTHHHSPIVEWESVEHILGGKDRNMIESYGVLYTTQAYSEDYHIMLSDASVKYNVFSHDRVADGEVYRIIDSLMSLYKIQVLWVYPDTLLSLWVQQSDFKMIPRELSYFAPKLDNESDRPYALRLGGEHVVMFPAYAHLKHSNKPGNQVWEVPTPDILLHSVNYLQRSIDYTLKYTSASTSIALLRDTNKGKHIKPMVYDRWHTIRGKVVTRPMWSHRLRNGVLGLTDEQKGKLFVVGGDKNAQFLGGCENLILPNGEPTEITNTSAIYQLYHDDKIPSLWEYRITDVSDSAFNSYELYCPLSRKDNWASGELLRYCEQVNIGLHFEIVRGLAWKENVGTALDKWVGKMWFALSGLKYHHDRFPDAIARDNALGTVKKMYVDVIGRFSADYSKEYYQRAWGTLIIHRAIRNQLASIGSRVQKYGVAPALVINDAFYILTDEPSLELAYPDILLYKSELRGYKDIGVCPLSDSIIAAFETCTPHQIETIIKKEMLEYATI